MTTAGRRWMLAAPAVAMLLFVVAPAQAVDEGKTLPMRAGEEFSWAPPPGDYFLYVTAGSEGLLLDVSRASIEFGANTTRLDPRQSEGTLLNVSVNETLEVRVLEGGGVGILARPDLLRDLPIEGAPRHQLAEGTLLGEACRAFYFSTSRMTEFARVEAQGPLTFVLLASDLAERSRGEGALTANLDPDKDSAVIIQGCSGPASNAANYRIETTYPIPRPAAGLEMAIVLGMAVTVALLRSRRPV
jgi:hypothetical protein